MTNQPATTLDRHGVPGGANQLHAGWHLQRRPGRLTAYRLEDEFELEFTGRLAEPSELARLGNVPGAMGSLARAMSEPAEAPTLGRLLAPRGWGHLFLELTGRCNERCLHCYASAAPEVEEALDWPTMERVLGEAKRLGFTSVQLTGGDPLLSPHLVEAAKLANQLGFTIEVYTNGLALREELARTLQALGARLALSFYSHDPKIHDEVTGTLGSQERTLRAILLAIGLGIRVRVAIIATGINGADVERTRAFLLERGVPEDAVRASREVSVGRGSFREDQAEFAWGATHSAGSQRLGKLCVTYQGRVVPCIFDRQMVLGDVQNESLEQIVGRDLNLLTFPRRLRSAAEELACGDCRFRRNVLGG